MDGWHNTVQRSLQTTIDAAVNWLSPEHDALFLQENEDWSVVEQIRPGSLNGVAPIEGCADLRSATSASSLTSGDSDHRRLDPYTKAVNVFHQRRLLSPMIPGILLQIVQSQVGTPKALLEAEFWRRDARYQLRQAPLAEQQKLEKVIEQFDLVHNELAALFSNEHICIRETPTNNGPKTDVDVTKGFKRQTAAELVNFIRRTGAKLKLAAELLKPDYEAKRGFAEVYERIRVLEAQIPPLNFLQHLSHVNEMDYGKTVHLVNSLEKLPSWLRDFRSIYASMPSMMGGRIAGTDSDHSDDNASLITVPMGDRETKGGAVILDAACADPTK